MIAAEQHNEVTLTMARVSSQTYNTGLVLLGMTLLVFTTASTLTLVFGPAVGPAKLNKQFGLFTHRIGELQGYNGWL